MFSDVIRKDMIIAMKENDKEKKLALSMLLGALQAKEKEKRTALTEVEAIEVLMKEIKQTKETIETANGRTDIIETSKLRLSVLEEYAPEMMTESQILMTLNQVLESLGIYETATKADKGKVMKVLMPQVKGHADSKLVATVVDGRLQ